MTIQSFEDEDENEDEDDWDKMFKNRYGAFMNRIRRACAMSLPAEAAYSKRNRPGLRDGSCF